MMKIHETIKGGGWPNCDQMATDMEAGLRTIKRDVELMQERLKMPIAYDRQRHGFFYTRPVDKFPSMPTTESAMFAMLVAHKAIVRYHGTEFQKPLEMASKKMTGMLDREERYSLEQLQEALSFLPFAPDDTDLRGFQTVTQALQSKQALRFTYRNLGAKAAQERLAHPYHLACVENHWYLVARDVKREAIRTFPLSRLANPEETGDRSTPPKDFNPDEYLRGSFNVFKGRMTLMWSCRSTNGPRT